MDKKTGKEKVLQGCLILVLGLGLLVPLTVVLNGLLTRLFWAWFVAAPFGVRPIGVAEAIGVACLVQLVSPTGPDLKQEYQLPAGPLFVKAFSRLGILWLIGYLAHLWL